MIVPERLRRVWNDFFFRGFSGDSLALLRIAFGVGLLFFHFSQFDHVFRSHVHGPSYYFLDPIWYFQLLGIDWLSPVGNYVAFALLLLFTITMILGLWTRTSIGLVILLIFYLKGTRDSVTGDVHHRYLMPVQILFFLMLSKSGQLRSLDARIRRWRGRAAMRIEEWEASWPIKAMQLYVVSFYFWSGIAKLRVSGFEWFEGGQRLQSILLKRALFWGAAENGVPDGNPIGWALAHHPELCLILSLTVLAMELGFPLLLCVRRPLWRAVLLAGVFAFHVANLFLLYVGFALIPIVFLVFFDLAKWRRRDPSAPTGARPVQGSGSSPGPESEGRGAPSTATI